MNFLHDLAKERGAEHVRLKVDPRNKAATELYRSIGYVFEPQPDGQLIGLLELDRKSVKRLKIGITAHDFLNWSGGIDFLWTVTDSLLATPRAESAGLHLIVPDSGTRKICLETRWRIFGAANANHACNRAKFANAFSEFGDRITAHHVDVGRARFAT